MISQKNGSKKLPACFLWVSDTVIVVQESKPIILGMEAHHKVGPAEGEIIVRHPVVDMGLPRRVVCGSTVVLQG